MKMTRNPYQVLDISKDSTDEEIKNAYRQKVKEVHPDVGGDKDSFQEVKEAYEKLMGDGDDIVNNVFCNRNNKNNKNNKKEKDDIYPSTVYYMNYDLIDLKGWNMNQDIFETHSVDDYSEIDFGKFKVKRGDSILESAEKNGYKWPFSCRGGACSNCAIKVLKGDVKTPKHHILNEKLLKEGYRLSCIGKPLEKEVYIVYNINKHPDIQNLLLPSRES